MSLMLLGILNAQASGPTGPLYFLATLGDAENNQTGFHHLRTDGANSFYLSGTKANKAFYALGITANGSVKFQRTLDDGETKQAVASDIDSLGNMYLVGENFLSGGAGANAFLAKYNTSGVVQFQRALKGTPFSENFMAVKVNSSDEAVAVGNTQVDLGALIAKYDATGFLLFQRGVSPSAGSLDGRGVDTDAAGNIYLAATNTVLGNSKVCGMKLDSSGAIVWQRHVGDNPSLFARFAKVSADGSLYVGGLQSNVGAGGFDGFIYKWNTDGVFQWQRNIGSAGTDFLLGLASNSDNNVYGIGQTVVDSQAAILIVKFDATGSIVFQRTLSSTLSDSGRSIGLDQNGDMLISGLTTSSGEGSNDIFYARLPADGSLTGTYVLGGESYTYAASSLTVSTTTLTTGSTSFTAAGLDLTSSIPTVPDSALSFTLDKTII